MGFKPFIVKNKMISTIIGTLAIYLGIAFSLPLNNFSVYITSYIHLKQDFVTMHYGMFIHLIFSFSMTFSSPLGGILENCIGFFKTIFVGLVIIFIGSFGFIYQQNIWLCYGLSLVMGIGAGISTSLLGKNIVLFAPNKKGLISGLLIIGVVAVTAIFTYTGEKIINYEGVTLEEGENFYKEYICERTYIYFIFGSISIPVGFLISILFLHEYKKEDENNANKELTQKIDDKENKNESENEALEKVNENKEATNEVLDKIKKEKAKKNIKQAIKNLRLWRLGLIALFLNFSISFMSNTGRTFGALIGINGKALQFLSVLQAISFSISSPILGALVDKKGPLFILRIVTIICVIPGILLALFMDITSVFILAYFINVLGVSGIAIGFGLFIMEVYGIQESVILGGIISIFSKLSEMTTTVTAFIVSFFYETGEELKTPYRILYIISSSLCILSVFLLVIESKEKFTYSLETSSDEEENNAINRESLKSEE